MDGGTNAKGLRASGQIRSFLDFIHEIHPNPTGWKFNAWVVTHWDADHHYGMLECMQDEGFIRNNFEGFVEKNFESRRLYCGASVPTKQTSKRHPLKQKSCEQFLKGYRGFLDPNHHVFDKALIGVDLFTGEQVFTDTSQPVENLQFGHPVNSEPSRPRFCVLGAGGYGIGQSKSFAPSGMPTSNQTSILAMLFWPESGKCSYYTGGDGFPAVEGTSICGLLNNKRLMRGPVHVIKLDHHGSSRELLPPLAETSVNQLSNNIVAGFMPKKIIVTPGKRYGHPSWSVILFLQDYFKKGGYGKALYTTRFPYWMTGNPRRSDINVLKFNDIEALREQAIEIAHLSEEDLGPSVLDKEDLPDTDDDEDFDVQGALLEEAGDIMETEIEIMANEKTEKKEFFEKKIKEYLEGKKRLRWIPKKVMRRIGKDYKIFKNEQYNTMTVELSDAYLNAAKVEPAVDKDFIYGLIPQEDRDIIASVCGYLWKTVSAQELKEDPHYFLRVTSNADKDDVVEFFDSESGSWKH
ncbi:MAG: hypothetical protein M1840_001749 [Geoglossum simile]|nr:MAG: hypothetical protein M1840_001749 [Geoglossum simile]